MFQIPEKNSPKNSNLNEMRIFVHLYKCVQMHICTKNFYYYYSHSHSSCTKSDCVLNFQFFDRLFWYNQHLIKEHPKDELPLWKAKLCQGSTKLPPLQDHQDTTEIHLYFYDPVDTQLEGIFCEKEISDKIPTGITHSHSVSNVNIPKKIPFSTPTLESCTRIGVRMRKWLHWKYHFT